MYNHSPSDARLIVVCIFGYSSLAKDILDSLDKDGRLKVVLVTRSIIEQQRAEIDAKIAVELNSVIKEVDLWVIVTPSDDEPDFRNKTEENLEFIPASTSIFSKEKIRMLKDEAMIANMCNFSCTLALSDIFSESPDVRMSLYPD